MIRRLSPVPRLAATLVLVTLVAACGRRDTADVTTDGTVVTDGADASQQLRVADVSLGRAVDANRRVTDETDEFRSTDVIHASVRTEGSANDATLTARWHYQDGQVVDESSQPISPTGTAHTEFHIAMPAGLPTGDYRVEILLNGQSVHTKSLKVN
jgi:hypothetical protein